MKQDARVTLSNNTAPMGPYAHAITGPEVTILMGVYNGAPYLSEQLESIASQLHINWRLIASDDGSTDSSREILARFAKNFEHGRVEIRLGPCRGFSQNYLAMVRSLGPRPGWIAFADQDDVWLPHRLSSGIKALTRLEGQRNAIHCSRSFITRQDLTQPRLSAIRPKQPSFRNALVQNIASGNTILATPEAAELIVEATRLIEEVVAHDWWVYQIVTGGGGTVIHEDTPSILYRQHDDNAIGANDSLKAQFHRIRMMLSGTFKEWNAINLIALEQAQELLTPDARELLWGMAQLRREPSPLSRFALLKKLGLYRQTALSQLALNLTALMGKM